MIGGAIGRYEQNKFDKMLHVISSQSGDVEEHTAGGSAGILERVTEICNGDNAPAVYLKWCVVAFGRLHRKVVERAHGQVYAAGEHRG